MVDFSFVEITAKKRNEYIKRGYMQSDYNFTNLVTNFVTAIDDNKGTEVIKEVNSSFERGYYQPKSDYCVLYLYDLEDTVSFDMLYRYGGQLHQDSSANLAVLTYFDREIMKSWSDVQFKEEIHPCESNNYYKTKKIVKELQDYFGIKRLPAMVILKKTNQGEKSFNIEVNSKNPKDIYFLIKEVIETIKYNYSKDFSIIEEILTGKETDQIVNNSEFNVNDFIETLIVKERKNHAYHKYSLAIELNFDVRTLLDRRKKNEFTRDECFYIAVRFHINNNQLESLLHACHHPQLSLEGRDAIIREAFYDKWEIEELEDELNRNGYPPLIDRSEK